MGWSSCVSPGNWPERAFGEGRRSRYIYGIDYTLGISLPAAFMVYFHFSSRNISELTGDRSLSYQFIIGIPRSSSLWPIAVPTVYLWIVDTLALRRGTWVIETGTKLGFHLWPGLEVEWVFSNSLKRYKLT